MRQLAKTTPIVYGDLDNVEILGKERGADVAKGAFISPIVLRNDHPFKHLDSHELEAFGFGRAHHRVLHFVHRYPGLKVADLLDVSIETVRSHIRSIYSKVGATSRESLFSKLRPYRL